MRNILHKIIHGLLLILGVTFISFLLMVWFGPDQTYTLIGKNATASQIAEVRHQLGYDQPFTQRYLDYLAELFALMLPGFIIGNLLGITLGLSAAFRRDTWSDRLIAGLSVTGMSISFLIIIIALQVLLSTPYGLNLFPVRGWQVEDLSSYLAYVTVPTLSLIMVTLGYNTRFYRAVFIEESSREHIRTARAFGASPATLMWRHVLKNSLVPVTTRFLFSIPLVVISGSLLIETYFGIPGIGKVSFDAITSGDQPVLKAVVGLTAVAFVLIQIVADFIYRLVDPRIA